jgi:hypothetical protein
MGDAKVRQKPAVGERYFIVDTMELDPDDALASAFESNIIGIIF